MSTITSTSLGNGNGAYATDIVVKDLDLTLTTLKTALQSPTWQCPKNAKSIRLCTFGPLTISALQL